MQVLICALRARPTAGPVNQVLWEAKQVWQNMRLLYVLVYHRAYNTYYINTWYLVPGTVLRYGYRHLEQQYEYTTTVYTCCAQSVLLAAFSALLL